MLTKTGFKTIFFNKNDVIVIKFDIIFIKFSFITLIKLYKFNKIYIKFDEKFVIFIKNDC